MSLSTTITGRVAAPRLFRPSHATPPVRAPSPITAMTRRSHCPCRANALAMPSTQARLTEAWEFSTQSCGDSWRLGYPDRPSAWRSVAKSLPRPVSSLCG
ncbi:Uncharacterised protein [Mycobacterium tuberculosis]|uniref:Uncharacterized protein n=1 Tax=Mycobacterium tuberculosis TaxID=1773 RepID=A0A0U0RUD2_MYCTX|nr:Uncharacterised protein [Mycobacterium tuberculosis]